MLSKSNGELSACAKAVKTHFISNSALTRKSQYAGSPPFTLQIRTAQVSPVHCRQRGGGFTQAGASVKLGREQMMMLPALCQTRMHPRLRETAR